MEKYRVDEDIPGEATLKELLMTCMCIVPHIWPSRGLIKHIRPRRRGSCLAVGGWPLVKAVADM